MEFTGTIERIGATVTVSEKFKKRDFVVNDEGQSYPQSVIFEAHQDRVDLLDSLKVGDEVTVKFNLKGRNWTNPAGEVKTFNTLQAWSIVKTGAPKTPEQPTLPLTPNNDLPF